MTASLVTGRWRKSSHSSQTNACVEVAGNLPGVTAVRDSKNPGGPVLLFGNPTFGAFAKAVACGRLDLP
ncbi:DUF397 domain-containing protein [Streptoalloteichus hindustanus]|uniref:DUF397 domain-containing protein n=1 Tax=Streptoalloteichus hindustanus TaxID=2017 RepID=A0A1M4W802_STRHI|nr:DUF397 domain-containing protein [Streptoalloteichus hindustanus]SHE77391.1 protein of unknown function [Streptoalloteichus hindustanus]